MRYLGILVVLVLMLTSVGNVMAAKAVTTGFQQHLVLSAAKPTPVGSATLCLQKLWTAETKGEYSFIHLGLRNVTASGLSFEPICGYVGGWYPASDGVTVGSKFGLKQGPFAINLSFEWFTNTAGGYRQHTKFWSHTTTYQLGRWTAGAMFQKVDIVEKVAPILSYKGGEHWTVEGRWYTSLNEDPKLGCRVNNGRLVLKIS